MNNLKNKTIILIDSSTSNIQVGVLYDNAWLSFCSTNRSSLKSIFFLVERSLFRLRRRIKDIDKFFICNGPGLILSIKIGMMAVKVWNYQFTKSYFLYDSLHAASFMIECIYLPYVLIMPFNHNFFYSIYFNKDCLKSKVILNENEVREISLPVFCIRNNKLSIVKAGTALRYNFQNYPKIFSSLSPLI